MNAAQFLGAAALLVATSVAQAQTAGPNDAQIAAIVVSANQVDIDAGKLAESKSASLEIKRFAQQMIKDHSGVNKAATDLATRIKLKPSDNATSTSLRKNGADTLARLKLHAGAAFDKAYVENEVAYHQMVLDAMDNTLIPSAKNEDLKALLVKVRPAFVAHLGHAKQLHATLAKQGR